MGDLTVVDGVALSRLVEAYRDVLRTHQDALNRLNVYPVPDGDTGTNMALTIESVSAELGDATDLDTVCRAVAHGSLMGAHGNSGVILSQILRGLTEAFRSGSAIGPAELAAGLRTGADAAYAAVMHPVEGTILTVAREAALAAELATENGGTLRDVLEAGDAAAYGAVARTPDLLPALRQAGVVDAGGLGLALLFDAWLHVVAGRPLPEPPTGEPDRAASAVGAAAAAHGGGLPGGPGSDLGPRYEVMFLLAAPDDSVAGFRAAWDALGDSVVVVGGDGEWNCHVHTDDIGAAIEAGIAVGRPARIQVADLHEQTHAREADWVAGERAKPRGGGTAPSAVVAVASGNGIVTLLRNLGVTGIVPGGQSMNPSTQQILEVVEQTGAASVVVLPNNKNIVPVAEQVAALATRAVEVLPTYSVVEALAAMVEYDDTCSARDNRAAMGLAAAGVRAGEVTRAVRDAVADCGPIWVGDWLAITPEGIGAATATVHEAAVVVLDRLVGADAELVTVLVGADVDPGDVDRLRDHVARAFPAVELEVHDGGQPLYPLLIGVE